MISQLFQTTGVTPLTISDFILNLIIAFLCGLIHITVYRMSYRGAGYSISMLNSLVMLAVITALTIMVIGDSLARAFGLVGAMSIIRFRTAIKDVMDVVHIFLALAIGMTAGVGLRFGAVIGTVSVCFIYLLLIQFNLFSTVRGQYILQMTIYSDNGKGEAEPGYLKIIRSMTSDYRLLNIRTGADESFEISYFIKPPSNAQISELINSLNKLESIKSVVIFSEEEQF